VGTLRRGEGSKTTTTGFRGGEHWRRFRGQREIIKKTCAHVYTYMCLCILVRRRWATPTCRGGGYGTRAGHLPPTSDA